MKSFHNKNYNIMPNNKLKQPLIGKPEKKDDENANKLYHLVFYEDNVNIEVISTEYFRVFVINYDD